jgi:magnesium-protoporphyrin O-methyltransferase
MDKALAQADAGATYRERRAALQEYFDRTAAARWAQLTSTAPVGRIRRTVREGRTRMRALLLSWLPADLRGERVLDAGCGTGALAAELARRGARVVGVDLSPTMIALARERAPAGVARHLEFHAGDMLDPTLGVFDRVMAMDSLIHYERRDFVGALSILAQRTRQSMLLTYAPWSVGLAVMHAVGRLLPSGVRAPAIEPLREESLYTELYAAHALSEWTPGATQHIASGFYRSTALTIERARGGSDRDPDEPCAAFTGGTAA